jgi:subtilisin family serine protease
MALLPGGLHATKVAILPTVVLALKCSARYRSRPNHPDSLVARLLVNPFISGEAVQDQNGHGTHCIGTACGPKTPSTLPRYGIAYNAEIFAGKVLSNRGSGTDGGIIAGIEWAIGKGCK